MRNGREEKYNQKYGLAYGRDHAMGLFVQIWKIDPKFSLQAYENMPDGDNILVDYDQFSGSLNPDSKKAVQSIVNIAEKYGFDLSSEMSPDDTEIVYD